MFGLFGGKKKKEFMSDNENNKITIILPMKKSPILPLF